MNRSFVVSLLACALVLGALLPTRAAAPLASDGTTATCFLHASNSLALGGQKTDVFDVAKGLDGAYFRRGTDLEEFFAINAETQDWFGKLVRALHLRGVDLVFIPLPTRGIVQYADLDTSDPDQAIYDRDFAKSEFETYVSELKAAGVETVDVLNEIAATDSWKTFFYLKDHHWTTTGAQEVARWTASLIRQIPKYPSLSKFEFDLRATGPTAYKSAMALDVQQRCHIEVQPEQDTSYELTRPAATESDLFGDAKQSNPVALAGTSFSAHAFLYFQPFLEEETALQVSNYSVVGGEFDAALASVLMSRHFAVTPPPIIVWESPSYYDINFKVRSDFPQLVPAIFGPCPADQAVATATVEGAAAQTLQLDLDQTKAVSGPAYYVAIDTDPLANAPVILDLTFSSGDHLTERLGDFKTVSNDGRYYFMLNSEMHGLLTSLNVKPAQTPSHLSISVCKVPAQFTAGSDS